MLVKDYNRKSKFDPIFLPDPFDVVNVEDISKKAILEGLQSGKTIVRHLDDLKEFHGTLDIVPGDLVSEGPTTGLSNDEIVAQQAVLEEYDYQDAVSTTESQGRVGTRTSSRVRTAPQRLIEEI